MRKAMRVTAIGAIAAMAVVILGLAYGAGAQSEARAQTGKGEVTLIAPGGARAAVEALIPGFEKKTGYKVKATYGSGGGTHKQVVNGDAFDVPIVQPPYQDVIDSGNVVKSSEKPLATVAVGVAVKQGAPKPDISSPEAVKKMFASAKSISYPDPKGGAAAGVTVDEMFKKLGIADQVEVEAQARAGRRGRDEDGRERRRGDRHDVPERNGRAGHRRGRAVAKIGGYADVAGGICFRAREEC